LHQNALQIFISRNEDKNYLAGLSYANNRNRLEYGGSFYGILRYAELEGARDYGGSLHTQYSLFQQGFHLANTKLHFIADDEYTNKNTGTLSVNYSYLYQQNLRLYANELYYLSSFAKLDRGDQFLGAKAKWSTGLPFDFFFGINGKYVDSNTKELTQARGIRFSNKQFNPSEDISDFEIAALSGPFYAANAWQAGGHIKKQFDLPLYFFTFPISLRREALYVSQNHFKASDTNNYSKEFNETIGGVTIEFLLLNKYPLPISAEIIHNDNTLDEVTYRIKLDL